MNLPRETVSKANRAHDRGALRMLTALLLFLTAPNMAATADDIVVPLEETPSGHRTISTMINGEGPFLFVFDTGANHTAIVQPLAEHFGFRSLWEDYSTVQAITHRFEAERFTLDRLSVVDASPMRVESVVIPVATDQTIHVSGLLGSDAIPSPRYAVDFGRNELSLTPSPIRYADGQFGQLAVPIGRATLRSAMRGVHVLIDSGSARTLVNPQLARRLNQRSQASIVRVQGVSGLDQEEEAVPIRIRNLEIGGVCVHTMGVLEADLEIFESLNWDAVPAMVIGMDVLEGARITIDRESGLFELESTHTATRCRNNDHRDLAVTQ